MMSNKMTSAQKIKREILLLAKKRFRVDGLDCEIDDSNVDELYLKTEGLEDAISEIRCSGQETSIPTQYSQHSRHYDSHSVAFKTVDGSWVGWTYWFGGGKFGEPELIEWIEDSYDLNVTEQEKLVVVMTFEKVEATHEQ